MGGALRRRGGKKGEVIALLENEFRQINLGLSSDNLILTLMVFML